MSEGVTPFRNKTIEYPFPALPPKFCGIISQRYRPRMGDPAKSFQQWIDAIKWTVMQELVPALTICGMSLTVAEFNSASPADTPYNLINISDFNSLIAQSQKFSTPVFALSNEQIEQAGFVLQTMAKSRDDFREAFHILANTIEIMTGIKPKPLKKAP
jgi:hypothetical protein